MFISRYRSEISKSHALYLRLRRARVGEALEHLGERLVGFICLDDIGSVGVHFLIALASTLQVSKFFV